MSTLKRKQSDKYVSLQDFYNAYRDQQVETLKRIVPVVNLEYYDEDDLIINARNYTVEQVKEFLYNFLQLNFPWDIIRTLKIPLVYSKYFMNNNSDLIWLYDILKITYPQFCIIDFYCQTIGFIKTIVLNIEDIEKIFNFILDKNTKILYEFPNLSSVKIVSWRALVLQTQFPQVFNLKTHLEELLINNLDYPVLLEEICKYIYNLLQNTSEHPDLECIKKQCTNVFEIICNRIISLPSKTVSNHFSGISNIIVKYLHGFINHNTLNINTSTFSNYRIIQNCVINETIEHMAILIDYLILCNYSFDINILSYPTEINKNLSYYSDDNASIIRRKANNIVCILLYSCFFRMHKLIKRNPGTDSNIVSFNSRHINSEIFRTKCDVHECTHCAGCCRSWCKHYSESLNKTSEIRKKIWSSEIDRIVQEPMEEFFLYNTMKFIKAYRNKTGTTEEQEIGRNYIERYNMFIEYIKHLKEIILTGTLQSAHIISQQEKNLEK